MLFSQLKGGNMRKLFLFPILGLFFLSFVSLQAQSVQSGSFNFNKKDTYNYTLHDKDGIRSVEVEITFEKPFETKPKVSLGVTMIDQTNQSSLRYSTEAKSVSRDGFVIKVTVWGETKVEGIGGFWVAHE